MLAGLGFRLCGRLALLGLPAGAFLSLAGGALRLLTRQAFGLLASEPLSLLALAGLTGLLLGEALCLKLSLSFSLSLGLAGLLLPAGLTGLGRLDRGLHAGPLVLASLGLRAGLSLLAR